MLDPRVDDLKPKPKAQNSPEALESMVFGPESLKRCVDDIKSAP